MKKQYNIDESMTPAVIWYEEDGVRYSFSAIEESPHYQAYLNPEAALSTPNV
jgi:hypothetical protein